jgi:hypothetical protein
MIDEWLRSASISEVRIFRRVSKSGIVSKEAIWEKAVWHVARQYAA